MSRSIKLAAVLSLAIAGALPGTLPAGAGAGVNAGTLTCSLSTSKVDPPEPAKSAVSCTFKSIVGADARFDGVIKRFGVAEDRDARIVLVWSVVAPEAKLAIESLEGKYFGSIASRGDSPAPGAADGSETTLIGGHDNSIQLRALTPDPNISQGNGVAVLELELSRMRT